MRDYDSPPHFLGPAVSIVVLAFGCTATTWLLTRFSDAAQEQLSRALAAMTTFGIVVGSVVGAIAAVAIVIALIIGLRQRWAASRTQTIMPTPHGIFPLVLHEGNYLNLNEPRVHALAVYTANGGRGTAPTVRALNDFATPGFASTPLLAAGTGTDNPWSAGEVETMNPSDYVHISEVEPQLRRLALPVGVDAQGKLTWQEFDQDTWLLVAGATGFGKSNFFAFVVQALLTADPQGRAMRLHCIDMKRVTLSKLPPSLKALGQPVATDIGQAQRSLSTLRRIMEYRFGKFGQAKVVDIQGWNQERPEERMPYLVLIIDEIAMLHPSMRYGITDKGLLTTLHGDLWRVITQGRAAGIVGAFGTQYPSREVIDPQLKANCPHRLCFHLPTSANYKLILDENSAAVPAIKGRALYLASDLSPVQVPDVGLREGEFDRFIAGVLARPGTTRARPVEWALPAQREDAIDVVALNVTPTPTPIDHDRKWDDFAFRYLTRFPNSGPSTLARAMSLHDGNGGTYVDYRNYKGMAARYVDAYPLAKRQNGFDAIPLNA